MRRHGVTRNPASAERRRPPHRQLQRRVPGADRRAAGRRCSSSAAEHEQDAALYLAAAQTGLRQGELRALAVDGRRLRRSTGFHVRRSAAVGSGARDQDAQVRAGAIGADGSAGRGGARRAVAARAFHRRAGSRVRQRRRRGRERHADAPPLLPGARARRVARRSASTICGTCSGRWPSRCSRSQTCRRCSATRTHLDHVALPPSHDDAASADGDRPDTVESLFGDDDE